MKSKGISARLIAGFLLVMLLIAALSLQSIDVGQEFLEESVGTGSTFLAEEMLKSMDYSIYVKVETLQVYANNLALQEMLSASNKQFEKLENIAVYLDQKDMEWVSAPKNQITPFMQNLIENDVSNKFRKELTEVYQRKYGYQVFGEVFVTNKYGANVAQTGKTSDYRQDDEEWWQNAVKKDFSVSDVEYDDSVGTHAISIAVRVDDEAGNFLGEMKAVVAVGGIVR